MHSPSKQIRDLVERGALFVLNHSAGKDSQAMTAMVRSIVPASQLLVIHADLGRVEWPGNVEHIRSTIGDLDLTVCRNENKDFLEMVRRRGKFPSPQQRQCTSDLKRDPINREIRRHLKANPRYGGLVVNCMGIRAEESAMRSRAKPFKLNARNSIAGREWYDWLPIFDMDLATVWKTIADAGQSRHWAYDLGMSRLSCSLCIMASKCDLAIAAKARPKLYREYVETERAIGHAMIMPKKGHAPLGLEAVTGVPVSDQSTADRAIAA